MFGERENTSQLGITTRFIKDLFNFIDKDEKKTNFTIMVSYLEIYNEKICDLLNPSGDRHNYVIREDKYKGTYITNLIQKPIESEGEMLEILDEGTARRTVAATKMNQYSSRSHSVMTVMMEQVDKNDEDGFSLRMNKLSLIDLAGSERASSTEATGDRLKEGAAINLSLSNLGNVINALVKKSNFVPYRNSTLTRLLKDSLGGNSFTLMVSCLSGASVNAEESLSTLYFSDRAKQIKNKLTISRGDPRLDKINELLLNEKMLKEKIRQLEKRLADCNCDGKKCCTIL